MKKKKNILSVLFSISVVVLLSSCAQQDNSDASTDGREKITLLLDWKSEPTYAGFYIAKKLGYFLEEGIEATIVEGNGATISAQLIGIGDEYVIGSNSGAATAIARSKGIDLKSTAVLYHEIPTVIYSLERRPIREPSDLIEARIGLIDGSITKDEYIGLIQANNLDRNEIIELSTGFDVSPLLSNQVDGLMNYAELTPVQLRIDGYPVVTMRLSDYGVSAYSLNLIANGKFANEHPETVSKITRAVTKGYEFVKNDPEQSARIFLDLFPEKSEEFVNASMKIVAQQIDGEKVGEQSVEGWQMTIDTLESLGLLNTGLEAADVIFETSDG